MANDSVLSSECSVCGENFSNTQECLKHELVKHSLQKTISWPQNRTQKRLNATNKFLNTDEKQNERISLRQQLNNCESGQELKKIFELFCMKTDNLGLIFTRIQTCLERELRSAGIARIYPFGSIASGLALRDCDIDIYLDVTDIKTSPLHKKHNQNKKEEFHQLKAYNRITNILYRSRQFNGVYAIRGARVPIIKCTHNDTGFSIDINVSYPSSRENTQFIHDLVKSDERIHELMLFMKIWAKNTQIIGRDNMNSYGLITMVIFFLQQPRPIDNKDTRILKSIKELQENCPFHMVQGVNYAYDIISEENLPHIPDSVSTWDLIKEFFNFYEKFNFEDYVISPYYGTAIAKTNLTPEICSEYYKQIRTITQYLKGEPANNLQIERCMCVQDAFCLNQNTTKGISPQNKNYILYCLQNAKKICDNPQNLTLAGLYEQLLFETVKITASKTKEFLKTEVITNLKNLKLPPVEATKANNNNDSNLIFTVTPSKADLRLVAAHFPKLIAGKEILQCWAEHYVEAISTILTKIYRMDVHKQMPTQQKQQKLDKEENDKDLNRSWIISCTVDLWTNRCFQKKLQTTFMSYQLEQTELMHNLRRQDPKFSINLNRNLKINILPNNKGIEIKVDLNDEAGVVTKKCPLRKFFNVFKNTLQNCTFKEILAIDNANVETSEEDKVTTPDNVSMTNSDAN